MKKRINILIIDHAPILGGAELYAIELAERLNKDKFRFIFAVTNKNLLSNKDIECVGFTSNRLKTINPISSLSFLFFSVVQLIKIVRNYKIDIIQTNTVRTHILGTVVALLLLKPLIWVNHSYDFPHFIFKLLSIIPVKIVYVSETLRRHYHPLVNRKNQIEIIYNGIDLKELSKHTDNSYLAKRFSLNFGENKIGIIGRIESSKGQEYFIKSIPDVLKKLPDSKFFIIGEVSPGEEDYLQYLKNLIKELEIEDNVIFTGFIENRFEIIRCLDVIIHISVEPESFGRVIVEAMAMGKPVIATKIGASGEIIENGIDGILIPPGDSTRLAESIIKILTNKELRQELGDNGKKKVLKKYNIDETVDRFTKLYYKICKKVYSEDQRYL